MMAMVLCHIGLCCNPPCVEIWEPKPICFWAVRKVSRGFVAFAGKNWKLQLVVGLHGR